VQSVLTLLKIDLGISHNLRDAFFIQLLKSSQQELEKKGINLNLDSADDQMLLSDYSAWAYRKRQEDVPLANNILQRIRNRIIKERIAKQDAQTEI
jgi:hypothetical protein